MKRSTIITIPIVLSLILILTSALPALAQTPCEGYGSTSTTVYTSTSQVNDDMADGSVSNVTIDYSHSDDMVRVPDNSYVVFDRVTFIGDGTGDTGHSLEIKRNSKADVTRSAFIGTPTEDHIQLQQHRFTRIGLPDDPTSGNCFNTGVGEDHIDIKETTNTSRSVGINYNIFLSSNRWCVLSHAGPKTVHFRSNVCVGGAYFRHSAHDGIISNNNFDNKLWLDQVNNYTITGNDFADEVRFGAHNTNPSASFTLNTWGSFIYHNGSCTRASNVNPPSSLISNCSPE